MPACQVSCLSMYIYVQGNFDLRRRWGGIVSALYFGVSSVILTRIWNANLIFCITICAIITTIHEMQESSFAIELLLEVKEVLSPWNNSILMFCSLCSTLGILTGVWARSCIFCMVLYKWNDRSFKMWDKTRIIAKTIDNKSKRENCILTILQRMEGVEFFII